MNLEDLGWSKFHAEAFEPFAQAGLEPARVALEHRGGYQVVTPELGLVPAGITGRLRHGLRNAAERPTVGDWVAVRISKDINKATIHHVTPRRTALVRHAVGRASQEQMLAANIDVVFVLASLADDLNIRRIDRFIAVAAESKAKVVLLLTKSDLASGPELAAERVRSAVPGVPVILTSTVKRQGFRQALSHLEPRSTTVIIGPSGVGKSSLINGIWGDDRLAVQEVRESDQRGRHTTTERQLLPLPNGALVIDTPGLRELQVWIQETELREAFADIENLALGCKFTTCRHLDEPGCALRSALEQGRLSIERITSYHKLKGEAREQMLQRRHTEERKTRKRRNSGRQESQSGTDPLHTLAWQRHTPPNSQ
jgi:ribosome biogenesis GTPase